MERKRFILLKSVLAAEKAGREEVVDDSDKKKSVIILDKPEEIYKCRH